MKNHQGQKVTFPEVLNALRSSLRCKRISQDEGSTGRKHWMCGGGRVGGGGGEGGGEEEEEEGGEGQGEEE